MFIFSFSEAGSLMNLPFSKAFVIIAHKYQGKVFRIASIFLNDRIHIRRRKTRHRRNLVGENTD